MQEFNDLEAVLNTFRLNTKPYKEYDIEYKLLFFLSGKGYTAVGQKIDRYDKVNRFDIVIQQASKRFCIEIKNYADRSIVSQIDRYAAKFDGIIVVCWHASDSLRSIFAIQKPYAKVPISLIEISRNSIPF